MRYLPFLLWFGLLVYCLVDIAQSDAHRVRALPKSAWFVLVVLFPFLGPIAWLIWGRPLRAQGSGRPSSARRAHVPAPDDDPDFLAAIARSNARRERERRLREQRDQPDDEPPATG